MSWVIFCYFLNFNLGKATECDEVHTYPSMPNAMYCEKKTAVGVDTIGIYPMNSCFAERKKK